MGLQRDRECHRVFLIERGGRMYRFIFASMFVLTTVSAQPALSQTRGHFSPLGTSPKDEAPHPVDGLPSTRLNIGMAGESGEAAARSATLLYNHYHPDTP